MKHYLFMLLALPYALPAHAGNWLSARGVYRGPAQFCSMRLSAITSDGLLSFVGEGCAETRHIYFRASKTRADVFEALLFDPKGTPDPKNVLIVDSVESLTLDVRGTRTTYTLERD